MFQVCYDETQADYIVNPQDKVKPTKDDWSHGTLMIIEELLRCSNMDAEVV